MKYVIDVPDFDKYNMPSPTKGRVVAIPITIDDTTFNIPTEMAFIEPYTEPDLTQIKLDARYDGYDAGCEDGVKAGWGLAQKIATMTYSELEYADIPQDWRLLSYQEAKTKYYEWKAKKESSVDVGDEIYAISNPNIRAYVAKTDGKHFEGYALTNVYNYCSVGEKYGFAYNTLDSWKKTGRHFDTVEDILKAMKGEV